MASLAPAELHPVAMDSVVIPLARRCTTIGRNDDNDLVIDDARASRYHARIWRDGDGYRVEDLDSLNGSWLNGDLLSGSARPLDDGAVVRIGSTELRFEQPRTSTVVGRTMLELQKTTLLGGEAPGLREGGAAPAPTGPLEQRPRRRSGWQMKQVPSGRGDVHVVLSNTRTGQYLQLTERDRFLWDRLDGEHTIRDLLFEYVQEYGQLALPRINALLGQLNAVGLLSGVKQPAAASGRGARLRGGVTRALTRMEFSIAGIDNSLQRLYQRGGWRFFTRGGLILVWGLVIGGIIAFSEARKHERLFDVAGAGVWGVIAAIVGYVVALSIHELAHALAVKSYGRQVRRGGLMIMMGMPYAFVDTTDMWFEARRARIVVSLAGPVATAAFGGLLAIGAATLPGSVAPGICFQVAFGLYINTLFNFNPLIPLDGYYILIDILEMPRLREEASAYFRKGVWIDLVHRRMPTRRQWGLALYGLVALVGTIGFLFMGLFLWQTRLSGPVHEHVPAPFDQVIVVAGLLLLFFPTWYGPTLKIRRAVQRRRLARPRAEAAAAA